MITDRQGSDVGYTLVNCANIMAYQCVWNVNKTEQARVTYQYCGQPNLHIRKFFRNQSNYLAQKTRYVTRNLSTQSFQTPSRLLVYHAPSISLCVENTKHKQTLKLIGYLSVSKGEFIFGCYIRISKVD